MKKTIACLLPVWLVLLSLSCSVETDVKPQYTDKGTSLQSASDRLHAFTWNGRTYRFHYGKWNRLDSVVVSEGDVLYYVYKATYENKLIQRVDLWDGGEIVATNDQFAFNQRGAVTGYRYTFYLPDLEEGVSTLMEVGYDQRGRIASLGGTLTYDQRGNLVQWQQGTFTYQYIYDEYANPLNGIRNLFVILVEEPFYWDYILSRHNSLSKTGIDGSSVTFTNGYDSRKRLISKTATRNGTVEERFFFTY